MTMLRLHNLPLILRAQWQNRATRDAVFIFATAIAVYAAAETFDLFDKTYIFAKQYAAYELDDLLMVLMAVGIAMIVFAYRRIQDLKCEIDRRRTAELEVAEQATRLATALGNMSQGLIMFDQAQRIVFLNGQYLKMYDLSPEVVKPGLTFQQLIQHRIESGLLERNADQYHSEVLRKLAKGHTINRVVETTDGRQISITNRPMANGGWVTTHEDVTKTKQAEARIAHMAHHDELTGLPNRSAFNRRMTAALEHAASTAETFAVLCFDLDRFKEVNDLFGHTVGDALLREVTHRLLTAADGAFLARLGGDEFVVISAGAPQPELAEATARRMIAALAADIEVDGHLLRAGLSIGIAVYPNDGDDAATLFANADAALYRAKREARGSIRLFDPPMGKRLRERRALQHDLQSAVARHEMALHYQPQALIGGDIIGFEALARWHHPSRGSVSPHHFISLAEDSGLIVSLGEWILREGCREAASWPCPLQIAINLSPVQFRQGDLARLVHSVLLETGLAPGRLELEITEGVLINDPSRTLSVLRRLKTIGVRIAMDDFGTGYSSLSYLQSFPFDKIKIDKTFIKNVTKNPQSAAIVGAVLALGHGLGLPVIAEGVETEDQLAFLRKADCDQMQGFLIGRPRPINSYVEILGRTSERARAVVNR
jgi:diguanylate cyclase (GGDEF)-like protein/PAS domain S-box-containing protein